MQMQLLVQSAQQQVPFKSHTSIRGLSKLVHVAWDYMKPSSSEAGSGPPSIGGARNAPVGLKK